MTVTIQAKSGVFTLEPDQGESLLQAGLRSGLSLPYECATGTCGTCRARVMEGDVSPGWPDAPGRKAIKPERGDILMCQAAAQGDCTVRVPSDSVHARQNGAIGVIGHWQGVLEMPRRLTHDVCQFDVTLSKPMAFDAGQFVVLSTPALVGGRAYSMVNMPAGGNTLRFVIKRKPGGAFSQWLFDNDHGHTALRIFGPLGAASFQPGKDGNLVCICGGSGIAGIMSILTQAAAAGHFSQHRAHLYFGVRTFADAFYIQELNGLVQQSGGALAVTLALSDEEPPAEIHPEYSGIRLAQGFVHEVAAQSLDDAAIRNATGFVAGPPPMVDGAIRTLITAGMAANSIRYDKFN